MTDIPLYPTFMKIEPLEKGWSSENKYQIETADGKQLLLRIAHINCYKRKKSEYEMIRKAAALGVPVSEPIDFGLCNGGENVYTLLTWVEGSDVESVLPECTETEQYIWGMKAGALLQKLHAIPAPETAKPWNIWLEDRIQRQINFYHANSIKSDHGDMIIRFLKENQILTDNRPQTYNHGDYSVSNLITMPNGEIGVIDFNFFGSNKGCGDPWWEFCAVAWESELSPYFHTGMIRGYFGGEPPQEFFVIISYYFAYSALSALCATVRDEEGNPEDGRRHVENILRWFDNMQNPVPTWYLKDFHVQWTDGMPYKLKEPL